MSRTARRRADGRVLSLTLARSARSVTSDEGKSAFLGELLLLSEDKQRDRLERLFKGYMKATTG